MSPVHASGNVTVWAGRSESWLAGRRRGDVSPDRRNRAPSRLRWVAGICPARARGSNARRGVLARRLGCRSRQAKPRSRRSAYRWHGKRERRSSLQGSNEPWRWKGVDVRYAWRQSHHARTKLEPGARKGAAGQKLLVGGRRLRSQPWCVTVHALAPRTILALSPWFAAREHST